MGYLRISGTVAFGEEWGTKESEGDWQSGRNRVSQNQRKSGSWGQIRYLKIGGKLAYTDRVPQNYRESNITSESEGGLQSGRSRGNVN